jgi:hypothetical protein
MIAPSYHERAGHRTRVTNLAATAEKVVLATSQDGAASARRVAISATPNHAQGPNLLTRSS